MELNQLRYFLTVARAENITKAAAELYITQSALSRVILRLENELGTPLFDRHSGRITLNDKGKAFLSHVSVAINELDEGVREVSADAAPHSFSMYNYLATNIFELITSRCQAMYPSLEFVNHNYEVRDEDDPIRKFSPEIVMTPEGEMKSYSVYKQYTERWCVLMNKKFQLQTPSDDGKITLSQLSRETIAFFGSPYDRAFVEELFKSQGLTPKLHPVENTAESGSMINRCKAVGVAPVGNFRYIVGQIAEMPLKAMLISGAEASRPVYLMKKHRFPSSDEERGALDYIVSCLDDDHNQVEAFIKDYFGK